MCLPACLPACLPVFITRLSSTYNTHGRPARQPASPSLPTCSGTNAVAACPLALASRQPLKWQKSEDEPVLAWRR